MFFCCIESPSTSLTHGGLTPSMGLEPMTTRLKVVRSTDWANRVSFGFLVHHHSLTEARFELAKHTQGILSASPLTARELCRLPPTPPPSFPISLAAEQPITNYWSNYWTSDNTMYTSLIERTRLLRIPSRYHSYLRSLYPFKTAYLSTPILLPHTYGGSFGCISYTTTPHTIYFLFFKSIFINYLH